jgi:hypothetical protein
MSKKPMDEIAQCAASAIRRAGAHGCNGNYHGGNPSVSICSPNTNSDNVCARHSCCGVLAEITRDIRVGRNWFFLAAQFPD